MPPVAIADHPSIGHDSLYEGAAAVMQGPLPAVGTRARTVFTPDRPQLVIEVHTCARARPAFQEGENSVREERYRRRWEKDVMLRFCSAVHRRASS